MGKPKSEKLPEICLDVAKTLQEASIKLGMRSTLGYVQTEEERKALREIHEIIFPEQKTADIVPRTVLVQASALLIDAWAGIPVDYLPPVCKLMVVKQLARQLRDLPLHI